MEQTIGKRIMTLRKSRGMTQDQLAEKLGVSPQAVSKWENDISCPDINLLPKLAELFRVSIDSLFGMPEQREVADPPLQRDLPVVCSVPEAEEPDEFPEEEPEDCTSSPWNGLPMLATAVLLFAAALLLNRTLLSGLGHAGIWSLLWPSAVLASGLNSMSQRISFGNVVLTGFGGYHLLVNLHILPTWDGLGWGIAIPALLILWALFKLFGHVLTGKKEPETANSCMLHSEKLQHETCFSSETVKLHASVFRGGEFDTVFGSTVIDLTDCKTVEPGGVLHGDAVFSSVTLKLPRNWKLEQRTDRVGASVITHGEPDEDADQLLVLKADVVFGSLEICW